jgi:hypothetical protein
MVIGFILLHVACIVVRLIDNWKDDRYPKESGNVFDYWSLFITYSRRLSKRCLMNVVVRLIALTRGSNVSQPANWPGLIVSSGENSLALSLIECRRTRDNRPSQRLSGRRRHQTLPSKLSLRQSIHLPHHHSV